MPSADVEVDREVNSLISWMGGKRLLAKTICALLPEHRTYVEPFGGAGWVLFTKDPSTAEVYNDLDGRLIALFRSVKHHAPEFVREIDNLLPSRELFDLLKDQPGLTEIQRAARFYYVLKMSFGAKGETFGTWKKQAVRLLPEKVAVDVEAVRQRLARVAIEHADFEEVLRRYDSPETAAFVDPPYLDCTPYHVSFEAEDHARLRAVLGELRGRWLLTYNDHPKVRAMYEPYRRYQVEAAYTVSGARQPGPQLIIMNYRPTRAQLAAAPKKLVPVPRKRRRGGQKGTG